MSPVYTKPKPTLDYLLPILTAKLAEDVHQAARRHTEVRGLVPADPDQPPLPGDTRYLKIVELLADEWMSRLEAAQ